MTIEKHSFEGDGLTRQIIEAIIKVHSVLGPGFVEGIYHNALILELIERGLSVETEKEINIFYQGRPVGKHRIDILVAERVVVELKTVEELGRVHYAKIRSCLKAANLKLGLLVNFSAERADFRRVELA